MINYNFVVELRSTCKGVCDFDDPKEFDDPQFFDDPKWISIGSMDFDNPQVYGDASIVDGHVF